jgi:7-carboxy-7-deazaguanine synthase
MMPVSPAARAATRPNAAELRITEIFYSIQGESSKTGLPTVFVRLTGCPLRCRYCDTEYAFYGGEKMTLPAILDRVGEYRTPHVTITGGEPLAQKHCLTLLESLCDRGYQVSLETGGALDIAPVDKRVLIVLDIKTPGSGEVDRNRWQNLDLLKPTDQIKFVICDRADYEWSWQILRERALDRRCEVLFSPSHGQLDAARLADWILEDQLPVRLQIQLHKYLWGDVPGR